MPDNKDDHTKKILSAEDIEIWRLMTKGVTLLRGKNYIAPQSPDIEKPDLVQNSNSVNRFMSDVPKIKAETSSSQGREIDRNTARRLKKGEISVEGRLDLHGFNQGEARQALNNFILRSYAQDKRCVLVVTGKGNTGRTSDNWFHRTPGVLKQNVPHWLMEGDLRDIVLSSVPARPKDGGDGALYVYLRRKR